MTITNCATCGHPCPNCLVRYKIGDAVDVYLDSSYGWTEGVIQEILLQKKCYRIKTVDMQISADNCSMSPFLEMEFTNPHVAPHRTHCRDNWRQHIKHYDNINIECVVCVADCTEPRLLTCLHPKRWVACRIVRHCKVRHRILVVLERHEDHSLDSLWFSVDSPCLRYLWDWE